MFMCVQALEEQISQEESSSQALREEVMAKEQNVFELHSAMKEVRAAAPASLLMILLSQSCSL